jgi:hypothetical protein
MVSWRRSRPSPCAVLAATSIRAAGQRDTDIILQTDIVLSNQALPPLSRNSWYAARAYGAYTQVTVSFGPLALTAERQRHRKNVLRSRLKWKADKTMVGYRCYFLGNESRILARRDFYADSDTEALTTARALSSESKPRGFELWEGKRYIHGEDCTTAVIHH